jgi:hypothetical protein
MTSPFQIGGRANTLALLTFEEIVDGYIVSITSRTPQPKYV